MAYDDIVGRNPPNGTSFGRTTTEKVSMYGVSPVSQAAAITAPGTTASTTTTPAGYGTTTQADAVTTAVAAIVTALKNVGLTA